MFPIAFVVCSTPALACAPPTVIDVGDIPVSGTWEGVLQLRNDGDGPLALLGVEASCGCVEAFLARRTLASGEAEELVITLKMGERRGAFEERLSILTSSPIEPTRQIILRGTVTADVLLTPAQLAFPGLLADRQTESVLKSLRGALKGVRPVGMPPWLSLKVLHRGDAWHLLWTLKVQSLPSNLFEGETSLALKLDHPTVPAVRVYVNWQRRWPFVVTPPELSFATSHVRVPLHVRHVSGKPFRVLDVECSVTGLKVQSWREVEGSNAWLIVVEGDVQGLPGELRITTDVEACPIFTVPVLKAVPTIADTTMEARPK